MMIYPFTLAAHVYHQDGAGVGGLFITAVASSAPERFSSWSVALGDHAVTLTVGLLPLALITLPINNLPLYITSLI